MKSYTHDEFIKLVEQADMIYSHASLNAAIRVETRVRKKSLLNKLKDFDPSSEQAEIGFFCDVSFDHKGRKIMRII